MKTIIRMQRIGKFLQKVSLARRQRLSVEYFKRYTVHDKDIDDAKSKPRGIDIKKIINECDAANNDTDKRILYEMTGIQLQQDLFNDDSSFEDDLALMMDNILGYDDQINAIDKVKPSSSFSVPLLNGNQSGINETPLASNDDEKYKDDSATDFKIN